DGTLIGGPATTPLASFTLNPGTKMAKLLGPELVGINVNGGFVFVRTTNNVPLYGLELFFDRSGSFLANVAAGSLTAGISFTPPSGPAPPAAAGPGSPVLPGPPVQPGGPVVSTISTTRTTRNTTITITGSNFSPIAGN